MRRKKAVGRLLLLLLIGLISVPCWLTYRQMRQDKLDRALIAAIKRGDTPAAITLLAHGADANAHDEPDRKPASLWQLLMDALHHRHAAPATEPTALLVMLELRPTGQHSEYDGDVITVPAEDTHMTKALLEHRAKVNVQDNDGDTPLILAAAYECADTVKLLLSHGANVNARNSSGWTALLIAAAQGQTETVRLLLNHHADVSIKSENGVTALHLAKWERQADIVRMLKQAGAKE